jgi:hypothetical protein
MKLIEKIFALLNSIFTMPTLKEARVVVRKNNKK